MFREKCRNTCGKNVYKIDSVKIRDDRYAIPFLYFFSSNEDNDFNFKNLNEKKLVWVSTKWKLLKLSWIFHIMILQLTIPPIGTFKRSPRDKIQKVGWDYPYSIRVFSCPTRYTLIQRVTMLKINRQIFDDLFFPSRRRKTNIQNFSIKLPLYYRAFLCHYMAQN